MFDPAATTRIHRRACHLCEAMCGLRIELQGDLVTDIRGDPDDPHSRGFLCPKALAIKDVHEDPDRLRGPVRRGPQGWEPISWDEALRAAGAGLGGVQRRHGRDALAIYWGNPPTHQHGLVLTMNPAFHRLGTRNRYSAASIDQLPQYLVSREMFGNQLLFPIADVDRTDFWLIVGGNPLASNGSITSGANMRGRIAAIRERGGEVVVVDPRRSETAGVAGRHLAVRPGGDVWLLLGMLHTLFAEGLVRPGRAADWTVGLDRLPGLFAPHAPAAVAEAAGLEAAVIAGLAREFARAQRAVAYGRLGVCQTRDATLCHWLINLLNLLTGNLDQAGGAMFSTPAFDMAFLARLVEGGGRRARWNSRVRGLPEFSGELPVATLADEMLEPGEGQVRALLLVAGNPVLTSPNGRRLDRAMAGLEFCVAIDHYINESTCHANLILPPVSALERGNYEAAVSAVQVRNSARWSPAALPRPPEGREDWEILRDLVLETERARGDGWRAWPGQRLAAWLTPDRALDLGLKLGPHGAWRGAPARLSLERLRAQEQSIDLGALESRLPRGLHTRDGRVHAAPALMRDALAALAPQATPALVLIGRRDVRSNNSWLHNSERLVKGARRCTLLMHPQDARSRGLADGARVRLSSRTGAIEVELEISDTMRPGVVSLPHGWGHDRAGARLRVAACNPGASLNDVTDESLVDPVSGAAAVNGVAVEVCEIQRPSPAPGG